MKRCEVVVVGGGVIGAAAARALVLRGYHVCLVERGEPGAESTGAAAGILGAVSETDGDVMGRLGMRSAAMYAPWVEELIAATGLAIDFWKEGTIRVARNDEEAGRLAERRARADRLGAACVGLELAQLRRIEPALARSEICASVLFPDEGRVAGGPLCAALVADFESRGGTLISASAVSRLVTAAGRVVGVEHSGGSIACDAVVDAAGAWAGSTDDGVAELPVEPLHGQMVCVQAPRPLFRHTIYSEVVYAAARRDGRLLLGSTRERVGYAKQVTAGAVSAILRRAFGLSAAIRALPVADWWSGLRPLSGDGIPLVGFWPGVSGLLIASGHGRNGVLLAPLTAEAVVDCFEGRATAAVAAMDPARFAAD